MAIVSISRIQIRRGQKNSGSGIPQLAGGEFGWAVDAQELYIGNGSVTEGAPTVGNTKILTEHDNLFELSNLYIYKNGTGIKTGVTQDAPIQRALQDRLDDIVSVRSFGAEGLGGSFNETVELQRAIDQLFTGDGIGDIFNEQRVTLHIPAGTYNISNSLKLPPYATLIGDGSEHTIIQQTGNHAVLETVNGTRTATSAGDQSQTGPNNQAKFITVKGLTLKTFGNNSAIKLNSCSYSVFEDIKLVGTYNYMSPGLTPYTANFGIFLDGYSDGLGPNATTTSNNNIFNNIKIGSDEGVGEGFETAVKSDWAAKNNNFKNCSFEYCKYGFRLGTGTIPATESGPFRNSISHSRFSNILQHGIHIANGIDNISSNNYFISVGNNGAAETLPVHSIIKFNVDSLVSRNISSDDYFVRTTELTNGASIVPYVPEIEGSVSNSQNFNLISSVSYQPGAFYTKLRLPADIKKHYTINYNYTGGVGINALRHGVLEVLVDPILFTTSISDTYDFIGNVVFEPLISFKAELIVVSGVTTLQIQVKDEIPSDSNAPLLFQVKVQS